MGLLSDPDRQSNYLSILVKYGNVICVVVYLLNFFTFLALFHPLLRERTYFSENALLANQVDLTYNNELLAIRFEKQLKEMGNAKRVMPRDWIFEKLEIIGLEAYRQNFTVSHPFMNGPKSGENVYGILRAPRHSSRESLVLVVPYDSSTVYKSVPLSLSLAHHFRNQIYWAKDLIFLFSDSKLDGLQAWLQAYFGHSDHGAIKAAALEGRGGSMQAALSLELTQSSCDGLNFILEGMNGQLPNLDLFNVMDKLIRSNDGAVYLHGRRDPGTRNLYDNCMGMIGTSLMCMWQQASGRPSGGHALFLPYHIDGLTIRCQVPVGDPNKNNANMRYSNIARSIEGTVRPLNNLLERFHQSFFYYIMPSTNNYISIGMYIPALCVCLASSACKALALWIHSLEVVHSFSQEGIPPLKMVPNITEIFKLIVVSFLLPISVYFMVPRFNQLGQLFLSPVMGTMDKGDTLVLGLLLAFTIIAAVPLIFPTLCCPEKLTLKQKYVYKAILIFLTVIGIGSNSVDNFSLSYLLSLLAVPLMNLTLPAQTKWLRTLQKIFCLIISPITLVAILPIVSFIYLYPEEQINLDVAYTQIKIMIRKIVYESYVYNSLLFTQSLCLFVPLWFFHWYLLWVPTLTLDDLSHTEETTPKRSRKEKASKDESKKKDD